MTYSLLNKFGGVYRYYSASKSYSVWKYTNREWNNKTQRYRVVSYWCWKVGEHNAEGYGTKAQAMTAAEKYIETK